MPRRRSDGITPSWSQLCKLAAPQVGYFTGAQALLAGYSPQLLQYYIQKSLVERTSRGRNTFHLTRYPRAEGPEEELIILWLWTKGQGAFSHETALHLHGLWPVRPEPVCITLPQEWRRRRVKPPEAAVLYYADLPAEDLLVKDPILVTSPLRALVDCFIQGKDVERAIKHAIRRKLLRRSELVRALHQAGAQRPLSRIGSAR